MPKRVLKPKLVRKTRRLILRPFELSDFSTWAKAREGRLQSQNEFDPGPVPAKKNTRSHFLKALKRYRNGIRSDRLYVLGVFEKRTGHHVGSIDIPDFDTKKVKVAQFRRLAV